MTLFVYGCFALFSFVRENDTMKKKTIDKATGSCSKLTPSCKCSSQTFFSFNANNGLPLCIIGMVHLLFNTFTIMRNLSQESIVKPMAT